MKLNTLLLISVFQCAPVIALAQRIEIAPFGAFERMSKAPLGSLSGANSKDDDTRLHNAYGYGLRLTWNTKGYYGAELGYQRTHATLDSNYQADSTTPAVLLQDKVKIQQAQFNFLSYFMPPGERWRPFVTGGAQIYQYGAPGWTQWTTGSSRNYGANFGGGIKLKVIDHALVRLDVRDYIGGKPYALTFVDDTKSGGRIHQIEASLGVAITF